MHEGNEKCIQQFSTQWEDNLEDIKTDGRIILTCSLPAILVLAYLSAYPCFSSAVTFCSSTWGGKNGSQLILQDISLF
jgi:hypothetical protein